MKEALANILIALESIEIKGSKNLNCLLYAIQQVNAIKEESENAEK